MLECRLRLVGPLLSRATISRKLRFLESDEGEKPEGGWGIPPRRERCYLIQGRLETLEINASLCFTTVLRLSLL